MSRTDHKTTTREIRAAIQRHSENPNAERDRKVWWKSRSHHKWPAMMLREQRRTRRYADKRAIREGLNEHDTD